MRKVQGTSLIASLSLVITAQIVQAVAATTTLSQEEQVHVIGGKGGSNCAKMDTCQNCLPPRGCVPKITATGFICPCADVGRIGYGTTPRVYYQCDPTSNSSDSCTEFSDNAFCGPLQSLTFPGDSVFDNIMNEWTCSQGTCEDTVPMEWFVLTRCNL